MTACIYSPDGALRLEPDEFLDAGALPTLHHRYGLSTDSIESRVLAEL